MNSLKLTKQILRATEEAGYSEAKEVQLKSISRINGGQDLVVTGPEGCGKTSTMVLGVLSRLKYSTDEEPPRALILVSDRARVEAILERFELLGKYTGIKTIGLYPGVGLQGQKDALAEGVDVIIGTPDRVHDIYLKSGLNVNKMKMFILDDAEYIVKQGLQTLVRQIAERLPKCQHLVFAEVFHDKLDTLTQAFLSLPVYINIELPTEEQIPTAELVLYKVPNYKTKLNLLNFLLFDEDIFTKVLVIANTRITAESIYKSIYKRMPEEVGILRSKISTNLIYNSLEAFKDASDVRILVVANEEKDELDVHEIPYLLYFDLPPDKEQVIERFKIQNEEEQRIAITFATDIELSLVTKIEQAIGHSMQEEELPIGLIIEGDRQSHKNDEKEKATEDPSKGGAFHEKKASNAKTFNWTWKERLKTFGKKHRKNKRGE